MVWADAAAEAAGAGGGVGGRAPTEDARGAARAAAGDEVEADEAEATSGRTRGAEVEAAAVVDDDAEATDAETSAGPEGGTPSWPGGKELITYRRMYEYQGDSRTDAGTEKERAY